MKSQIIRQFRNALHVLIGFTVLYWLINMTDFNTYPFWQKLVGGLLGGLVGSGIGAGWEFFNFTVFQIKTSDLDVKLTAIGGALGFLTACFVVDLLPHWCIYVCLALVVLDIVRATIVKIKKSKQR